MRSIGKVGVEAMQKSVLVVVGIVTLQQLALVVLLDVLGTLHYEASRTHGRVADGVAQGGLHHVHHHTYDMARGAELTVVARGCHLAQHVFVDIAHGVAVVHVQGIYAFHYLHQCARVLNQESSTCHESAVGRFPARVEVLDEGECITADDAKHLLCLLVLEHAPAQRLVGHLAVRVGVVPCPLLEGGVLHRHTHNAGIGLLGLLRIVQHLHEEQICHLLQNGNGIRYATRPKRIPNGVYPTLYLTCNHNPFLFL